ncbi:MAG: hypothetical protein LIP23_09545 [Planctomycetes bacterium]|nr:hypothetical protein [Planctomycetota bacterium]
MRKAIVLGISALVAFGTWSAGCRQRDTAANFPKGPEVKNLARATSPQLREQAGPPVIPAAIDPEILSTPDQPTFARIRAVMDREAVLASRYSEPGLFVLPRQDYTEPAIAMSSYGSEVPVGMPIGRQTRSEISADLAQARPAPAAGQAQFWSSPTMTETPHPGGLLPPPADVSAMMPSASPQPIAQPGLLPESVPGVFSGLDTVETFHGIGPISRASPPPASSLTTFQPLTGPAFGDGRSEPLLAAAPVNELQFAVEPVNAETISQSMAATDSIPLAPVQSVDEILVAADNRVAELLATAEQEALKPLAPLSSLTSLPELAPLAPLSTFQAEPVLPALSA